MLPALSASQSCQRVCSRSRSWYKESYHLGQRTQQTLWVYRYLVEGQGETLYGVYDRLQYEDHNEKS